MTRLLRPSAAPTPVVRGVSAALLITLWIALVSIVTAFGYLHRYGSADLLFLVCLLMGLWVVSSLMAAPLRYIRSWANPFLWALLVLVMLQILPLPGVGVMAGGHPPSTPGGIALADGPQDFFNANQPASWVGRYSLRPVATSGVLILIAGAAALYWLLASSVAGRSSIRSMTWAVPLGLAPLALWAVLSGIVQKPLLGRDVFSLSSPVQILGGDSLVPALLAALPLSLAAVLRLLGWMPNRSYHRRERGWSWIGRSGPVWAAIGLALILLMAIALGMSNVPTWLLATCVALTVGFVLIWYAGQKGLSFRLRRRPLVLAGTIVLWILLGLGIGAAVGPARHPARTADADLWTIINSLSGPRAAFGVGAGAVSDRDIFGVAGWPASAGDDSDTNGYLLLRAEIGWVGLALVLAAAAAAAAFLLRAWRRAVSPWPRIMLLAGLGFLASNLFYFGYDASALLAPNLLALAAAGGIVTAWAAHGADWRTGQAADFRPAHWPLVLGATGILMTMALAESEMLTAVVGDTDEINNRAMHFHFGAFAVVCLLLCYALGPRPAGAD